MLCKHINCVSMYMHVQIKYLVIIKNVPFKMPDEGTGLGDLAHSSTESLTPLTLALYLLIHLLVFTLEAL